MLVNLSLKYLTAKRRASQGFSAIELLVTFAIIAILLLATLPNYRTLFSNNKASSIKADLMSAIRLARVEAIRRSAQVGICGLDSTHSSCVTDNPWQNGFQVYVVNSNPLQVIQKFPYTASNINACQSMLPVVFTPRGLLSQSPNCTMGTTNFAFDIQPLGASDHYLIMIDVSGRASTNKFQ